MLQAFQTAPPMPAWHCADGSNGRPYLVYRWKSGPLQRSGQPWPPGATLAFVSCGQGFTQGRCPAVSVRVSHNATWFAAGPFACER